MPSAWVAPPLASATPAPVLPLPATRTPPGRAPHGPPKGAASVRWPGQPFRREQGRPELVVTEATGPLVLALEDEDLDPRCGGAFLSALASDASASADAACAADCGAAGPR
ncbi:unnamed protein product, partial [Prorocentrum cordatum]